MRLLSVVMLAGAVTATAACGDNEFTAPTKPPTAAVRIVNGLSNGARVDVRAVDQVEWSPVANSLAYREATVYYPTEAKDRHIKVFAGCVSSTPSTCTTDAVSTVIIDTTITFQADTRVTVLLTGSSAAGAARRFVIISDDVTTPASGQISIRLVNTGSTAIDGYITAAKTDALPATATFSNVGALTASAYVGRTAGAAAARTTATGSTTVTATAAGSAAPATLAGANPGAGVTSAGTKFSVYYFPAAGTVTTATILWLVDRNPAD